MRDFGGTRESLSCGTKWPTFDTTLPGRYRVHRSVIGCFIFLHSLIFSSDDNMCLRLYSLSKMLHQESIQMHTRVSDAAWRALTRQINVDDGPQRRSPSPRSLATRVQRKRQQ